MCCGDTRATLWILKESFHENFNLPIEYTQWKTPLTFTS